MSPTTTTPMFPFKSMEQETPVPSVRGMSKPQLNMPPLQFHPFRNSPSPKLDLPTPQKNDPLTQWSNDLDNDFKHQQEPPPLPSSLYIRQWDNSYRTSEKEENRPMDSAGYPQLPKGDYNFSQESPSPLELPPLLIPGTMIAPHQSQSLLEYPQFLEFPPYQSSPSPCLLFAPSDPNHQSIWEMKDPETQTDQIQRLTELLESTDQHQDHVPEDVPSDIWTIPTSTFSSCHFTDSSHNPPMEATDWWTTPSTDLKTKTSDDTPDYTSTLHTKPNIVSDESSTMKGALKTLEPRRTISTGNNASKPTTSYPTTSNIFSRPPSPIDPWVPAQKIQKAIPTTMTDQNLLNSLSEDQWKKEIQDLKGWTPETTVPITHTETFPPRPAIQTPRPHHPAPLWLKTQLPWWVQMNLAVNTTANSTNNPTHGEDAATTTVRPTQTNLSQVTG